MYMYMYMCMSVCLCICICVCLCEATKQVRRDMHVCDTNDSYMTCLIRICIHVTWLMRMPRSTSERDTTDVYGTWLIHIWHDSIWHMNESRASHVTLTHINDRRARGEHSTADEWVQRARGGSTRDRRGTRRAEDLNTLWRLGWSLYSCRTSGWEWVGMQRERGAVWDGYNEWPDQWSGLFLEKGALHTQGSFAREGWSFELGRHSAAASTLPVLFCSARPSKTLRISCPLFVWSLFLHWSTYR